MRYCRHTSDGGEIKVTFQRGSRVWWWPNLRGSKWVSKFKSTAHSVSITSSLTSSITTSCKQERGTTAPDGDVFPGLACLRLSGRSSHHLPHMQRRREFESPCFRHTVLPSCSMISFTITQLLFLLYYLAPFLCLLSKKDGRTDVWLYRFWDHSFKDHTRFGFLMDFYSVLYSRALLSLSVDDTDLIREEGFGGFPNSSEPWMLPRFYPVNCFSIEHMISYFVTSLICWCP